MSTPSTSTTMTTGAEREAVAVVASRPSPARGREVHAAPSWRRGLAGLVDIVVCAPVWALLTWLTFPGDLPDVPWNWLDTYVDWFNADRGVLLWPMLNVLLVGYAYNAGFMAFGRETLGKRALALRTENAGGAFPQRKRALIYCGYKVLSTALLTLGHLWALADPARRTLHDRLGGVWVTITPRVKAPRRTDAARPQGSAEQ